ncbi:MAG: hypothetical protein ABIS01_00925, partial [Ferruginibacter sp.]
IKCNGENGIYVSGESADKITNIYFDQVDIRINKTTAIPGGIYDRRPANVEGFVKGHSSAFYFDKAKKITVRNSSVIWGNDRPAYFSHALESNAVANLQLFNFLGESAFPGKLKAIMK